MYAVEGKTDEQLSSFTLRRFWENEGRLLNILVQLNTYWCRWSQDQQPGVADGRSDESSCSKSNLLLVLLGVFAAPRWRRVFSHFAVLDMQMYTMISQALTFYCVHRITVEAAILDRYHLLEVSRQHVRTQQNGRIRRFFAWPADESLVRDGGILQARPRLKLMSGTRRQGACSRHSIQGQNNPLFLFFVGTIQHQQ